MKRRALAYCLIAVGVVAFWLTSRQNGEVEIKQFQWQLDGTKVSYSFSVVNHTGESVRAQVMLIAETKEGSNEGATILPRGRAQVELELAPSRSRNVSGSFVLSQRGDAHLAIYPQLVLPEKTTFAN